MNFVLLSLLLSISSPASEAPKTLPLAKVKGIFCPFSAARAKAAFDHEYLHHGGLEDLKKILAGNTRQFGKCLGLREATAGSYLLDYKEVSVPLELVLGDGDKIRNNFFGMPVHQNDSLAKIEAELKKEPYSVSFFVDTEEEKELLSRDADRALSISRANQIFLLQATQHAVKEGKLKLSDLVPLRSDQAVKTMGSIHAWRDGTLLSIDSLLNLMVAERDVAASDLLLSRLDSTTFTRLGKSLSPFPSFREYFLLAELDQSELKNRKHIATLLPGLKQKPLPLEYRLDRVDLVSTLGWFASAREVCRSALAVKDDIVSLNARLSAEYLSVHPKSIEKFGLIQTRDSGVSQVVAVFKAAHSPWACLALTANHTEEIEEGFFSSLYSRLMNLALEKMKK